MSMITTFSKFDESTHNEQRELGGGGGGGQ